LPEKNNDALALDFKENISNPIYASREKENRWFVVVLLMIRRE